LQTAIITSNVKNRTGRDKVEIPGECGEGRMNMFAGIVAVVILLLVYFFIRQPKTKSNVRPAERRHVSSKADSTFHAVSLKFTSRACEAAKAMDGRRFLSTAAPRIPLPACDALECSCRFVHHDDRRSGDDRRNTYAQGFGGGNTGSFEQEQRKRGERRDDPPDDGF
jgi:hypothetical protein